MFVAIPVPLVSILARKARHAEMAGLHIQVIIGVYINSFMVPA
jgi:hypothetical protein